MNQKFQKPKRLEVIETIFCCCEQKQTAMFLRWPQGREWQEALGLNVSVLQMQGTKLCKKLLGKYKF